MTEKLNTSKIRIPNTNSDEWKWARILCSIEYAPLYKPTSLQWVILSIINNLDKFSSDLRTNDIANKLGVEKRIIEEGIANLINSKFIVIKSRANKDVLQSYTLFNLTNLSFKRNEMVPGETSHKKIFIYRNSDNQYSYQKIEQAKSDADAKSLKLNFNSILLAIIEQIWLNISENPSILVKNVNLEFFSENSDKLLLKNKEMLVQNVNVNFL